MHDHVPLLLFSIKARGLSRTFWEPESKFLLCTFHRVRTVDDIAANINAVVTTDGTRCSI